MLIIRFSRTGKRNQAQFRVVVAEKSSPIKGRFVEQLGSWNPHQKEAALKVDRIKYWMEKGAAVSDSVFNLLVKERVVDEKKRKIVLKAKKIKGDAVDESADKENADKTADKESADKPADDSADKPADKDTADEKGASVKENAKSGKEEKPKEEVKKEEKPAEEEKGD